MAYTPKEWADGEEGGTPITADELNRMEAGIEAADEVTWSEIAGKPTTFAPTLGSTSSTAAAGDHTHTGLTADAAAGVGSVRTLGTGATQAAAGNHTHSGLTADAVAGTASIRTLGTGAQQAAAGNHVHTATQVTATAITPGSATTVQGILAELAARIAALETP